jgi:hypothetical protein
VECLDCRTWGTAVVSTAGVTKDESILGDIISFFKHPLDVIADAFHLDVRVDFENVGGHFEFEIFAADTVSYSFPIFESSELPAVRMSALAWFCSSTWSSPSQLKSILRLDSISLSLMAHTSLLILLAVISSTRACKFSHPLF